MAQVAGCAVEAFGGFGEVGGRNPAGGRGAEVLDQSPAGFRFREGKEEVILEEWSLGGRGTGVGWRRVRLEGAEEGRHDMDGAGSQGRKTDATRRKKA